MIFFFWYSIEIGKSNDSERCTMFHIMVEEDRNKKFEMNKRNWRVLVAIEGLSDSIFPTLLSDYLLQRCSSLDSINKFLH